MFIIGFMIFIIMIYSIASYGAVANMQKVLNDLKEENAKNE